MVQEACPALLAGGAALDALAEAALHALLRRIGQLLFAFAEAALLARLTVSQPAGEIGLEILLRRVRLLVHALLEAVLLLWLRGMLVMLHELVLPAPRLGIPRLSHEPLPLRPLDRPAEGLGDRRVAQAQLALRARAVVAVSVRERSHHLPADRRLSPAHAEGGLHQRRRGGGHAPREEAHVTADPRHLRPELQRLARRHRPAAEHVALARHAAFGGEQVAVHA